MTKKRKEKSRKKQAAAEHQKKEIEIKNGKETQPDGFDFGGIPPRNLKKNLGC